MKLFLLITPLVVAMSTWCCTAFSIGAGRCVVDEPAVSSLHLAGSPTTGDLSDGGYEITIDGEEVSDGDTVTVDSVGSPFDVEITGPRFKGVLIMLEDLDDSVIEPGPGLVHNEVGSGCIGEAAITHSSSSTKTRAVGTITLDEPTTTELALNIVVQNSRGKSVYYYSQVTLEVV